MIVVWFSLAIIVLVRFPYRRAHRAWRNRPDDGLPKHLRPGADAPPRITYKPGLDAAYDFEKAVTARRRARTRDLLKTQAEQLHQQNPPTVLHYPMSVKKTGSE